MESTKIANTTMFLVSVLITGAIAGAFVWLLLFLINLGIESLWDRVPMYLGAVYPLVVCIIGGIVIGLFVKRYGPYPEDLQTVMATVKKTGRYDYSKIGRMSVGAILPLAFGGSVGPEAGLTGAIAALCTWVGDRLKRFGGDFRELSRAGTYAALSAIFTAPLYGFAGAMDGSRADCDEELVISSRPMRIAVYAFAIIGAILTFILLSRVLGGGLSLPRYTDISYGTDELVWLIPIAVVGSLGGWLFCVLEVCFKRVSDLFGERPVLKAVIAGAVLGSLGIVLPLTMFSGELQAEELNGMWMTMSVTVLLATGFMKIAVTALCVNMGWRGGHFFPVIFSGISIGYGLSVMTGVDPVFSVCATTAAVVGGVMRRPLMAVLLLFLCFPVHSVAVLAVAAIIGAYMPLPGYVKRSMGAHQDYAGHENGCR